jgi:PPOX class probable F420-dependent enzyme
MARADLARVASERVGLLATVRPDGRPHVVATVFATVGDAVVTAIDWKPKGERRLQRLVNIEANPAVSFMVHHYSEDWDQLWWARVDGNAGIHRGGEAWNIAIAALREKYPQYRERPPEGEVIWITPTRVSSWASRPEVGS